MNKRYLKASALLSIAALALSACGGGNQGTAASPTSTASQPATAVQIQYLHRLPDGPGMTKVNDIVAKWNAQHPNIKVTATKFDGKASDMAKKLEADVAARTAPCLAQLGYGEIPEMFVKGMLEDVTAQAGKYKDKFFPGPFSLMGAGGVTVGLPQDTGPLIYMYNVAEFKKLGIEVPTTADEFKAAARKAASAGKYIGNFAADEAGYWLSAQAAGAGAQWYKVDNDKWVVNANGPETAKIAALWQEMLDTKSALTLDRWGEGYNKALVDGKLIGNIAAAWEVGFALDPLDKTPFAGQWRVAQLPDMGAGKTGPSGGSGVAVMKGCANIPQAMEFNAWFNTQLDDLASQGLVLAATGKAKTPEKWSKQFGGQDVMKELVEANNRMAEFPYIPNFSAVGAKMTEAAAAAASGKGKVGAIFAAGQDASIAALKDAGLPLANG